MGENTVAKVLNIVGIIEIVCGIIVFLFSAEKSISIGGIGLTVGLISGIAFMGFGEIINLLQQNIDNQRKILSKMVQIKSEPTTVKREKKTVLQDIESNLPEM